MPAVRVLAWWGAACAAALASPTLSGCSGDGAPPQATGTQGIALDARARLADRVGSSVVASLRLPSKRAHSWLSDRAKTGKNLLYVSSYGGGYVDIYDLKGHVENRLPEGTITAGLSGPQGMAVDRSLNLYVANTGNDTVTVYRPGSNRPSVTYSLGLDQPVGVAVGRDGTVYVANLGDTVVEYTDGRTTPARTLSIGAPVDCALDKENNLYVTYSGGIEEFAPGSRTGTQLGMRLSAPRGIQIDRYDNIVVANQAPPALLVFPQGQTVPSLTLGRSTSRIRIRFDTFGKKL